MGNYIRSPTAVVARTLAGSAATNLGAQTLNAAGAGARNSSVVLLAVATLAIGLDVGVARITYGVVLPAFARDLQLTSIRRDDFDECSNVSVRSARERKQS
jgi:hypothetical protein